MNNGNILIVTGKSNFSNELRSFLSSSGYGMADIAESGGEALRRVHMRYPDVVIITQKLQDMDGLDLALDIEATGISVLLAVGRSELDYAHKVCDGMNILIIPRPINKSILVQSVKMLLMSKKSLLDTELKNLKKDVEDKILIEKAKWLLMEKLEMTEPQAFRFIQKRSMDTRRTKIDVSLAIIGEMDE